MTRIVFYEKPGCGNNARQKAWLAAVGHEIEARNLLTHAWTCDELLRFFGNRPVPDWFNSASPRVRSGEVRPEELDAPAALSMMITDPLLIRRPLIEAGGRRETGFDLALVAGWLGLPESVVLDEGSGNIEGCPKSGNTEPCPTPPAANPTP
jgi:nitrogenase-associated protein